MALLQRGRSNTNAQPGEIFVVCCTGERKIRKSWQEGPRNSSRRGVLFAQDLRDFEVASVLRTSGIRRQDGTEGFFC